MPGPASGFLGKAFVDARFESAAWIVEIAMWSSGDAELTTVHVPDDRVVNKHYDLTGTADLAVLLDELTALLLRDEVPAAAVAFHASNGGPPRPASR